MRHILDLFSATVFNAIIPRNHYTSESLGTWTPEVRVVIFFRLPRLEWNQNTAQYDVSNVATYTEDLLVTLQYYAKTRKQRQGQAQVQALHQQPVLASPDKLKRLPGPALPVWWWTSQMMMTAAFPLRVILCEDKMLNLSVLHQYIKRRNYSFNQKRID
ncbi:Hypothetical protein SMAX5B_021400, partial [Scophthalmus maximus]